MPFPPSQNLDFAPLGKKSEYINQYTPSLLFPIPRKLKRDEIGVSPSLPFRGYDYWTAFELSWLNSKGKPVVALGEFKIPCQSPFLIESKSFKLYLNSFNNSPFESFEHVASVLTNDLSQATGEPVEVKLSRLHESPLQLKQPSGICIDDLDVQCDLYQPCPNYLETSEERVEETLFSDLLKSNCLVTGQPDWASLQIRYQGKKINREGVLKYIVSLRNHNEFHEQCVERIFMDILRKCQPEKLTVLARYTRRGGLDINPFRTNDPDANVANTRWVRQ